ncbi:DNA polymerase phi-domain-containing protein [Mycena floridula]|nr:DNA polymerase phi-domain-containing protein [Mycena floridula]
MTTTLPLFWSLSSTSRKERVGASVKLISALQQFQTQFVPKEDTSESDEEEDEEEKKSDGLDVLNAQDVSYSIRRLVRGLASPRESSRLGFAVALTELLSRMDTVTCSQIMSLIIDSTKTQGSMSGQEERDMLFARLFGFAAVVQSGLIVQTKPLPTSASSTTLPSNLPTYQELVTELLALGEKKSWLKESVWWTLGLAIDALHASEVSWKSAAIDFTIETVVGTSWSPEKIATVIKLQALYKNRSWQSFVSPVFKSADLLSTGNMPVLARILKESAIEEDEQHKDAPKAGPGSWKPQLHFVWDIILNELLPQNADTESTSKRPFPEFFRIVVDESLFSSTASQERKFWGFQVFQKALPRVTESTMPMLFTKNFMRTWINHLSQRDRYLHKVATQTVTEIESFVQKNPELGFSLIMQLTGVHGSQQFDKLTKTKTVESILTSMDSEGLKNYINFLLTQINQFEGIDSSDFKAINSRRLNSALPRSDDWMQMILDWLVVHGLFMIKKKSEKSPYRALHSVPNPPFSDDLREACRTRLQSCLADLTNQTVILTDGESKTVKASGVALDGTFWITKVLDTIEQLEKDTKRLVPLTELDEDAQDVYTEPKEMIVKLTKASGDLQDSAKGASLLLQSIILKMRCSDEQAAADIQSLQACTQAAKRMFSNKTKARTSSDEAEPLPVDVMVDVIIGFLEKSTAYMKTMANHVFALLSSSVEAPTIDLILAQLQRLDPIELQDEEEDDDMSGVEDEGDDAGDDQSESDESSDQEEGEEDSNDEDVDEVLREKIAKALGVDAAGDGSEEEDSDEELMDDDQMMAIDKQLAEVFNARVNEGRSKNGKSGPDSPLVIRLISPLVELVSTSSSDEKHLSDKAHGILRSRIAKAKEHPSSGVDVDEVTALLIALHKRASRLHSPPLLTTLNQVSLYVAKVMQQAEAKQAASSLNTSFFQDFIRRFPLSGKSVNVYRQCQAYQLLQALVTQMSSGTRTTRTKELSAFVKSLQTALLDVGRKACDDSVSMTAAQLKTVLKLAMVTARQRQRDPTIAQGLWDSQSWNALGDSLGLSARFKASPGLQTLCKQIAMTAAPGEGFRSVEEIGEAGDTVDRKVTKRKKTTKEKS